MRTTSRLVTSRPLLKMPVSSCFVVVNITCAVPLMSISRGRINNALKYWPVPMLATAAQQVGLYMKSMALHRCSSAAAAYVSGTSRQGWLSYRERARMLVRACAT